MLWFQFEDIWYLSLSPSPSSPSSWSFQRGGMPGPCGGFGGWRWQMKVSDPQLWKSLTPEQKYLQGRKWQNALKHQSHLAQTDNIVPLESCLSIIHSALSSGLIFTMSFLLLLTMSILLQVIQNKMKWWQKLSFFLFFFLYFIFDPNFKKSSSQSREDTGPCLNFSHYQ